SLEYQPTRGSAPACEDCQCPSSSTSCGTIEPLWRKKFNRSQDLGVKPGRFPGKKNYYISWKKLLWSPSPQVTRQLGTPAARVCDHLLRKPQPKCGRLGPRSFFSSLLHLFCYAPSVMPLLHVLSTRVLLHMLCHSPHQIRRGHRLPAMSLHRPSICKLALAFGIVQILGHLLKLVHRQIDRKSTRLNSSHVS